ncbi:unnamed protein product [Didymodactylos carnosus]|uniref:Uncharacterized protein n=1 Tax=Didymodactylos carnosus TaxID=1234261 RepID=A0A8S2EP30_9BILA|nr:unnamed protein product [Didymodactylos carnosus]CAF4006981.1 unnamed protein product [Didymodactylos carnosus]
MLNCSKSVSVVVCHGGVGVSAAMCREYFGPKAAIHFLEYDKTCGEKWMRERGQKLNVTMHYGSQDDVPFLKAFAGKHTKMFDVIIDDGGHRMTHQINSLTVLFPTSVRSGGVYAIEDIYTSYRPEFGGQYLNSATLIEFLKRLLDDIQSSVGTNITSTSLMLATTAYGVNIVVNGDGETGPCETSGVITPPTGWTPNGSITQVSYWEGGGTADQGFSSPGPM